jgi:UDPglucose 6-dehydrogenase
MVEKIRTALDGEVKGKTLCMLGLTFKPNTDDLRESPALSILDGLLEQGAEMRVFDPVAQSLVQQQARTHVAYCADEYEAAEGADALIIATEWNQFRGLDFERLKTSMRHPVMLDLRNVYEPEAMRGRGFTYTGVGR